MPPVLAEKPIITWIGTDEDYYPGHAYGLPIAIVIHSESGFMAGTDATFNDKDRDASTHFSVGLDGRVHQYVSLDDDAWGNGILEAGQRWTAHFGHPGVNPNHLTVSIETEDSIPGQGIGNAPVSDKQYASVRALIGGVIVPKFPTIKTITGHHVITPLNRPNCPGKRWTNGGIQALANELKLELFL